MEFAAPLLPGTLIKRYKRFFADVTLDSGETVTAHCANTGAMTGCAEPGYRVWLSPANNPKRKLQYTWELVQNADGDWIGINTNRANKIVAEALESGKIKQVADLTEIRAEYKPEGANSRFDFLLSNSGQSQCLLEVKSLTLKQQGIGYFPDAVTARGAKHCLELAEYAESGKRCVLVFCVQHTGIERVQVAHHIDPTYAQAVKTAVQSGVEIYAYGCHIDEEKIFINHELSLEL